MLHGCERELSRGRRLVPITVPACCGSLEELGVQTTCCQQGSKGLSPVGARRLMRNLAGHWLASAGQCLSRDRHESRSRESGDWAEHVRRCHFDSYKIFNTPAHLVGYLVSLHHHSFARFSLFSTPLNLHSSYTAVLSFETSKLLCIPLHSLQVIHPSTLYRQDVLL